MAGKWSAGPENLGSKRTIFLAPTVPLVEQQASVLKQHLSVEVGHFVGAMQVNWNLMKLTSFSKMKDQATWTFYFFLFFFLMSIKHLCRLWRRSSTDQLIRSRFKKFRAFKNASCSRLPFCFIKQRRDRFSGQRWAFDCRYRFESGTGCMKFYIENCFALIEKVHKV